MTSPIFMPSGRKEGADGGIILAVLSAEALVVAEIFPLS